MKDIIKKLGITPGPWQATGAYKQFVFKGAMVIADCSTNNVTKRYIPENTNLIATAPELLDALIERVMNDEECIPDSNNDMVKKLWNHLGYDKRLIERATGKTWEEIKELLIGSKPVQLIQTVIIDPKDWDMDADIAPEAE